MDVETTERKTPPAGLRSGSVSDGHLPILGRSPSYAAGVAHDGYVGSGAYGGDMVQVDATNQGAGETITAAVASTELPERPVASLSPSRAADFMSCPQLYQFRSIDALPEPPGREAVRGTLVHAVLEQLFDLPAADRDPEAATNLLPGVWQQAIADQPELPGLLFNGEEAWQRWLTEETVTEHDPQEAEKFLAECAEFVSRYFSLEDPTRLNPAEREMRLSVELPSGLVLRGIVDRLDRAPTGAVRVVDYKTGRSPGAGWEAKALFQMKFYGLMLWRLTGEVPARLQLLYLGNQERLAIDPTAADLLATEKKVEAVWAAISRATETGVWQPNRSRLCNWCSFQEICPAWADEQE